MRLVYLEQSPSLIAWLLKNMVSRKVNGKKSCLKKRKQGSFNANGTVSAKNNPMPKKVLVKLIAFWNKFAGKAKVPKHISTLRKHVTIRKALGSNWDKWLEVKPSSKEGNDLGLFTTKNFQAGEFIGWFAGEYDWKTPSNAPCSTDVGKYEFHLLDDGRKLV